MSVLDTVSALLSTLRERGEIEAGDYTLMEKVPLSKLTTFRTGGPATVLYCEKVRAAEAVVPFLLREKIPFFVLGNGSNVLALDEGYQGLVLSLARLKGTLFDGERVTAEAGVPITHLSKLCRDKGLGGMEFFYGIPGTVGGAVFMNAGAYGSECRDILESVVCLDNAGNKRTLSCEELGLSYRTSRFQKEFGVILSATFRLERAPKDAITTRMEDLMSRRIDKQPLEYPSAGSTFRRCEGRFTAKMIEEAGLKGYAVGGAKVSEKHAGFIINYDHATSADILNLITHIQKVLLEKEGVHIEREVRILE